MSTSDSSVIELSPQSNRRRKSTPEEVPDAKRPYSQASETEGSFSFPLLTVNGESKTIGHFLKDYRAIRGLHSLVVDCKKATYSVLSQQENVSEDDKLCHEFLSTYLSNLPKKDAFPNEIFKISSAFLCLLTICRSFLAQRSIQWNTLKTQLGKYWTNWESFHIHRSIDILDATERGFATILANPTTGDGDAMLHRIRSSSIEISSDETENVMSCQPSSGLEARSNQKEPMDPELHSRLLATLESLSHRFEDLKFSDLIRDFIGPVEHVQIEQMTEKIVQLLHDKTSGDKISPIHIKPFCKATLMLQHFHSQLVDAVEPEEDKEGVLSEFFQILKKYSSEQGLDLEEITAKICQEAELQLQQLFQLHHFSATDIPRNDLQIECLGGFLIPRQILTKLNFILVRHPKLYEEIAKIFREKMQAYDNFAAGLTLSPRELAAIRIWELISNTLPKEKPISSPEVPSEEEVVLLLKSSVAIWFNLLKIPGALPSRRFVKLQAWLTSHSDRRSHNIAVSIQMLMNFYETEIFGRFEDSLANIPYLRPTKLAAELVDLGFALLFAKLEHLDIEEERKKSLHQLILQGLQIFLIPDEERSEKEKMQFDVALTLRNVLAPFGILVQDGAREFQEKVIRFFEMMHLSLTDWMDDTSLEWAKIISNIYFSQFFESSWEIFKSNNETAISTFDAKSDEYFDFYVKMIDELEESIEDTSL